MARDEMSRTRAILSDVISRFNDSRRCVIWDSCFFFLRLFWPLSFLSSPAVSPRPRFTLGESWTLRAHAGMHTGGGTANVGRGIRGHGKRGRGVDEEDEDQEERTSG